MHSTYAAFLIAAFTVFAFSEAVPKSNPHFIVKNRFNYNNLFVRDIPIHDPCTPGDPDNQCVGPPGSSDCINNECLCTDDYIEKNDNSNCLARIGKPCDEDNGIICAEPYDRSFCNSEDPTDMQCECKDDFHPTLDGGTCLAKIGIPCDMDDDCIGSRTKCDNTCKCKEPHHIPNESGTSCFSRIGGECNLTEECTWHSEDPASVSCTSNQCQCTPDYVRGGAQQWSKCLPVRQKLYETCEESVQCRAGTPGQFSICTLSDPNEDGSDKWCTCSPDAVHEVNQHVCYEKRLLIGPTGGSCQIQAQCENLKARCTGDIDNPGVCQCEPDHVPRLNNTLCLERKRLGEMCEEEPQCTSGALCTPVDPDGNPIDEDPDDPKPKFCICDVYNGFIQYQDRCLRLATKLGDNCTENVQCVINIQNSECNDETKTCECPEIGFVANGANNKCLQIFTDVDRDDEFCEENVQCVSPPGVDDRRECVGTGENKTCKCLTGQYINPPPSPPLPDRCYKIVRDINQRCEHQIQCTTTMGDLSDCLDYKCQCKLSHYQFYSETGKCYIPSGLGQPCDEAEECIVGVNKNAFCNSTLDGRCDCLPGTIEYNGKCYEEKMIGNPCETDEECNVSIRGGQSQCDPHTKTCECKSGFQGDASGTLCSPVCNFI